MLVRSTSILIAAASAITATLAVPAAAQTVVGSTSTIHECVIGGKKAFQDRPCPAGTRAGERVVRRAVSDAVALPADMLTIAAEAMPPTPQETALTEPPLETATAAAEVLVEQIRIHEIERARVEETFEVGRINTLSMESSEEYVAARLESLERDRDRDLAKVNQSISHARTALRALLMRGA